MLFKKIVDFIYRLNQRRRAYEQEHPEEQVLIADISKGIRHKKDKALERNLDWAVSKRAILFLTKKRLQAGAWDIPLERIQQAQLIKINTLLGSGMVLKIETLDGDFFQFGMQTNPEWLQQTTLPLTLEKGQLKYSWFSIFIRLVLFAYLIYWLVRKFGLI